MLMPYLNLVDYRTNIQDRSYVQLVQNNDLKRVTAEQWAISIVRGKITQKYDVNAEFTDTLPYSPTKVYNARDRVIINFPLWLTATAYSPNACVIQNGIGYVCTNANSDATFTPSNWTAIGAQYTIYYASYPSTCTYLGQPNPATLANPFAPEFSVVDIAGGGEQRLYSLGDIVYWKGYTYANTAATQFITEADLIQYISYADIPYLNVFPDDTVNNAESQFWGSKTPYTVPVGTLPTNVAYWTVGDNRTPEIVECVKDCTLWKLSQLTNFPIKDWNERYTGALAQLSCYANGQATLLMPIILVPRGSRIRWGGKVLQQNIY